MNNQVYNAQAVSLSLNVNNALKSYHVAILFNQQGEGGVNHLFTNDSNFISGSLLVQERTVKGLFDQVERDDIQEEQVEQLLPNKTYMTVQDGLYSYNLASQFHKANLKVVEGPSYKHGEELLYLENKYPGFYDFQYSKSLKAEVDFCDEDIVVLFSDSFDDLDIQQESLSCALFPTRCHGLFLGVPMSLLEGLMDTNNLPSLSDLSTIEKSSLMELAKAEAKKARAGNVTTEGVSPRMLARTVAKTLRG